MKKCPECDLNYIQDFEEMCNVCAEKLNGGCSIQNHKAKKAVTFAEEFIFENRHAMLRGKNGFKAYNHKGLNVGIVFMTDDDRSPAYECCELCFYPEYHNRYGEWHRFTSHGQKIKWEHMVQQLNRNGIYKCYID